MSVTALVLAAGRGERLDAHAPKAFVSLLGRSLLERSLAVLLGHPGIDCVIPVVARADMARLEALDLGDPKLAPAVEGGIERQDSVRAGLAAVPESTEWVAVHDAARCLLTPEEIDRVLAAASECGAALLAVPVRDTIKRARGGRVIETPPRDQCWAAQTPQVFRVGLLRDALASADAAGVVGTDDAELVERSGAEVRVVEGEPSNLKITVAGDLAAAEQWLRMRGDTP